ncbi:unnamed protein product, partial [Rotaria sp. Silwood1]
VAVDFSSFQVFSIGTDLKQSEFSNHSCPVLAQPVYRSSSSSSSSTSNIDIDLQSSYFLLLDDNGVYQDDAAVICMDFGHLALKRTRKPKARERSYTQFKLKLENIQFIYANQNISKCIYSDDAILPAWKVAGNLPSVDLHSFNKYLFQIMNHIQSIPFPESKHSVVITQSIEPESTLVPSSLSSPE